MQGRGANHARAVEIDNSTLLLLYIYVDLFFSDFRGFAVYIHRALHSFSPSKSSDLLLFLSARTVPLTLVTGSRCLPGAAGGGCVSLRWSDLLFWQGKVRELHPRGGPVELCRGSCVGRLIDAGSVEGDRRG